MKTHVVLISLGAGLLVMSQLASAYRTEVYGKESMSTVYQVICEDGKKHLVRNENNGKWCSGSTCYDSLEALMRNAFSNCK